MKIRHLVSAVALSSTMLSLPASANFSDMVGGVYDATCGVARIAKGVLMLPVDAVVGTYNFASNHPYLFTATVATGGVFYFYPGAAVGIYTFAAPHVQGWAHTIYSAAAPRVATAYSAAAPHVHKFGYGVYTFAAPYATKAYTFAAPHATKVAPHVSTAYTFATHSASLALNGVKTNVPLFLAWITKPLASAAVDSVPQ